MSSIGTPDVIAQQAKGMASEAMAAVHSHERLTDIQFKFMENKQEEIKDLISRMNKKIDVGFKAYDNKFWSLAVAIIFILLGIVGFLVQYTLFHGGPNAS